MLPPQPMSTETALILCLSYSEATSSHFCVLEFLCTLRVTIGFWATKLTQLPSFQYSRLTRSFTLQLLMWMATHCADYYIYTARYKESLRNWSFFLYCNQSFLKKKKKTQSKLDSGFCVLSSGACGHMVRALAFGTDLTELTSVSFTVSDPRQLTQPEFLMLLLRTESSYTLALHVLFRKQAAQGTWPSTAATFQHNPGFPFLKRCKGTADG